MLQMYSMFYLSILCTAILKHGYIVNTILETVIIPVIKNKSGDATDKHNYRPIAISTTRSKVLELLMLHKIDSYLFTTDNQFGFKQNHGTVSYADDMAILSPSATALQKLLDICSVYSEKA